MLGDIKNTRAQMDRHRTKLIQLLKVRLWTSIASDIENTRAAKEVIIEQVIKPISPNNVTDINRETSIRTRIDARQQQKHSDRKRVVIDQVINSISPNNVMDINRGASIKTRVDARRHQEHSDRKEAFIGKMN